MLHSRSKTHKRHRNFRYARYSQLLSLTCLSSFYTALKIGAKKHRESGISFQVILQPPARAESKSFHPDRIPVICERDESCTDKDLEQIEKTKYLVPLDISLGQLVFVVRKKISLPPSKALTLFVDGNIPPTAASMSGKLLLLSAFVCKCLTTIPSHYSHL